ncbi:MAG: hypothetical protein ACYC2T_07895 [Bacillota bacterium]
MAKSGAGNSYEAQREQEIINGIQDSKHKYRKVIQAGIAKWVQDFQEGKIKIETVDDLRKLIDMDIELQQHDLVLNRRLAKVKTER